MSSRYERRRGSAGGALLLLIAAAALVVAILAICTDIFSGKKAPDKGTDDPPVTQTDGENTGDGTQSGDGQDPEGGGPPPGGGKAADDLDHRVAAMESPLRRLHHHRVPRLGRYLLMLAHRAFVHLRRRVRPFGPRREGCRAGQVACLANGVTGRIAGRDARRVGHIALGREPPR